MRIDLHTHSWVSDGTDSPTELVAAAAAAGLDVLALTDHDTSAGWSEAAAAAEEVGIALIRGIEISTRYRDRALHLLAYLPDPGHPSLVAMLGRVLEGRRDRTPRIVAQLRQAGVEITLADVERVSGASAASGRPHVADALVGLGVVEDRSEGFARFLNAGRPGFVPRYAPELHEALEVVAAAGGVPVIAHAWGRRTDHGLDPEAFAELAARGLAGIEVDHQDHPPAARARLREIAVGLDLVITGSSDYHGLGKVDHDLGVNTTDPAELERLLDLARRAADRAGRRTPTMLGRA